MLRSLFALICFCVLCPNVLGNIHGRAGAEHVNGKCPVIDPDGEIADDISFRSDREKESFKATIQGQVWLVRHEESRPMTVDLFSSDKKIRLIGVDKGVCTYHMDEPAFSTLFTLTPLMGQG